MKTIAEIIPTETYTTGDVAELCGVDHRTVRSWVQQKKLDALPTLGTAYRFRGVALLAAFSLKGAEMPRMAVRSGEDDLRELMAKKPRRVVNHRRG